MNITTNNERRLLKAGRDIEEATHKEANSMGFFPSRLIFIPLPVSRTEKTVYEQKNNQWTLRLQAGEYGLPFGVYPRLEIARLVSQAVKTQSRELTLNPISEHLREFNIIPSGGEKGTIKAYRNQMLRLFTTSINTTLKTPQVTQGQHFFLPTDYELWTQQTQRLNGADDIVPYIKLSETFYHEIIGDDAVKGSAVPFDMRALKILKHSTLQMDLYLFLTYRFNAIRGRKHIHWVSLKQQFGAGYGETSEALRNFKKKFLKALKAVLVVYPKATIGLDDAGIWLLRGTKNA